MLTWIELFLLKMCVNIHEQHLFNYFSSSRNAESRECSVWACMEKLLCHKDLVGNGSVFWWQVPLQTDSAFPAAASTYAKTIRGTYSGLNNKWLHFWMATWIYWHIVNSPKSEKLQCQKWYQNSFRPVVLGKERGVIVHQMHLAPDAVCSPLSSSPAHCVRVWNTCLFLFSFCD